MNKKQKHALAHLARAKQLLSFGEPDETHNRFPPPKPKPKEPDPPPDEHQWGYNRDEQPHYWENDGRSKNNKKHEHEGYSKYDEFYD